MMWVQKPKAVYVGPFSCYVRSFMAHFRTRPNSYAVGKAPTGRARCRACHQLVGRGELRFVTRAFVRPGRATTFVRHVSCMTPTFAAAVLAVHAQGVPIDGEDLDAETIVRVHSELSRIAVAPDGSTSVRASDGTVAPDSMRDARQRIAASSSLPLMGRHATPRLHTPCPCIR